MPPADFDVTSTQTSTSQFTSTSLTTQSKARYPLTKMLAWIVFFITCLLIFTILKLPQDQIKSLIEGQINMVLAPKGLTFIAREGKLEVGMGLSYSLKEISIIPSSGAGTIRLQELSISPTLLTFLKGRIGAQFNVVQSGNSQISGTFSKKMSAQSQDIQLKLKVSAFDFGKSGVLEIISPVAFSLDAQLSGEMEYSGDLTSPNAATGTIAFSLQKVSAPEQNILGFALPELLISEGRIEADISEGKIKPKNVFLGKAATDDIKLNVSGEVSLNRQLDNSALNLKLSLGFSPKVTKALPLIETFLLSSKQTDGTFLIPLTGTLGSPYVNLAGSVAGLATPALNQNPNAISPSSDDASLETDP